MRPLCISFILLFIIPFGLTAQTSSYTGEIGGEKIKGTFRENYVSQ